MFFCRPCQPQRSQGTQTISPSQPSLSISNQSASSLNNEPVITVRYKASLYNNYLQKYKDKPFTDPQFPPSIKSLRYEPQGRPVGWKRITEIVPDCLLFVEGIEQADVHMGNLGDVYFLPTIAALAKHPDRIRTVFHQHTETNKQGIYRLLVKERGIVREIVIDDYVPVYLDSGRPVFCKANGREVWVMLMEKAWAKLKGSYQAILNGCPHEVLTTFCFGPCRSYEITHKGSEMEKKIWKDMKQAHKNNYIFCATSSIHPQMSNLPERRIFTMMGLGEGYIMLHNYWNPEMPQMRMTRIQSSHLKSTIYSPSSASTRNSIKLQNKQLKMSISNFLDNFDRIDICHDNGTFNYKYKQLQVALMPILVKFQVQEDHEAYISISKAIPSGKGKQGYIRLLLAQSIGEGNYRLQASSMDSHFSDCFIHLQNMKIGQYVLMISAQFHDISECGLTLSYLWRNITSKDSMTDITQESPSSFPLYRFLESVFQSHSQHYQEGGVLKAQGSDLISCVSLFQECGYGYVVCKMPNKAKFRLQANIDQNQIEHNGLRLFGQWGEKESIRPGDHKIFIFELISEQLQIQFPPQGFSIKTII